MAPSRGGARAAAKEPRWPLWALIPASIVAYLRGLGPPQLLGSSEDACAIVALFLSVSVTVGAFIDEEALHSIFVQVAGGRGFPTWMLVLHWAVGLAIFCALLRLSDHPESLDKMYLELTVTFIGMTYLDFIYGVAHMECHSAHGERVRLWLYAGAVGPALVYALPVAFVAIKLGVSVLPQIVTADAAIIMSVPLLHFVALSPRIFPKREGEAGAADLEGFLGREGAPPGGGGRPLLSAPRLSYLCLLGWSLRRAPLPQCAVLLQAIPSQLLAVNPEVHLGLHALGVLAIVAAPFLCCSCMAGGRGPAGRSAVAVFWWACCMALLPAAVALYVSQRGIPLPSQRHDRLLAVLTGGGSPEAERHAGFWDVHGGISGNTSGESARSSTKAADLFHSVATEFYEYGWGDSFHFGFRQRHEGLHVATDNSQTFVAQKLGVGNMDRVLDMGCGIGGPLRSIVKRTGANITGISISAFQVRRAREITASLTPWMQARCHFLEEDYLNVRGLEEGSFDAAFYLESSLHCENRTETFLEAFRLLKPGGRLVAMEHALLGAWDPADPELARLAAMHRRGNGALSTPTVDGAVRMVRDAGFRVLEHFDYMALGQSIYGDAVWPWWQDLDFNLRFHVPAAHPWVRRAQPYVLGALAVLGLVPEEVPKTAALLNEGADGLAGLGVRGVITPQYYILGAKPGR